MTLQLFEGPAGSGKTTELFQALAARIAAYPLCSGQKVLALTKMHGSRRRMLGKLDEVLGRSQSECFTLNSFALGLVQRWRTLARAISGQIPSDTDFAGLAEVAAKLLSKSGMVRWVAARYPVLVVDELQDLRGSELDIIKHIGSGMHMLCAADEFQDLAPQGECESVAWARNAGSVVVLTQVRRTNVAGLLEAARITRAGGGPLVDGNGFKRMSAPSANVAASLIARNLTWAGDARVAILSPTGPTRAPFVRDTLARLAAKPFEKNGRAYGPFVIQWERPSESLMDEWSQKLALNESDADVTLAAIVGHADALPQPFVDWARTRNRVTGETHFTKKRILEQLGRTHSLLRAYGPSRTQQRTGMTVHQAKNREFDVVIVLWPMAVGGDMGVQRRLLYNAITRARRQCCVIVQDPKPTQSRLASAPFR